MEPVKKVTWKDLRVGLLALSSFVIVVTTIILMGGGQVNLFKETLKYRTFFPEANGLKTGSEVWLAGVEVGEVSMVRFSDPDDIKAVGAIEVELTVEEAVARQIRNDSVASLRTIGLLGDKYVEIQPGTPDAPVLRPGSTIPGISLSTFDELVGVGRTTAQGFNELMVQLRLLAEDINNQEGTLGKIIHDDTFYNNLNATVQRTDRLLDKAENGPGTLGRLMSDPKVYNNLVISLQKAQYTITALDSSLLMANDLINMLQNSEGTIGKLTNDPEMYDQMKHTLDRLDGLIQSVERGEGSLGKLVKNETTVQELEGLIIDMRTLIRDVRENPEKYIKVSVF
ncbi:MAG: MlaD family protein [Gemmatimonadota bacterium]|nr:MlaD family protein [Gemmatimonadota bacterium]